MSLERYYWSIDDKRQYVDRCKTTVPIANLELTRKLCKSQNRKLHWLDAASEIIIAEQKRMIDERN